MNTPIPFGVTIFVEHALINLRVRLNESLHDELKKAYPQLHMDYNSKGLTVIQGVLPVADYDRFFCWDFQHIQRRHKIMMLQLELDNIENIQAVIVSGADEPFSAEL